MNDMQWRDLMAGMALVGLLASGERGSNLPQEAYQYADDLIAAKDFDPEEFGAGIVSVKKGKGRVSK